MFTVKMIVGLALGLLCCCVLAAPLTLTQAINEAIEFDPSLQLNRYQQQMLEQKSDAVAARPDPSFSLALNNVPSDNWALNREAMTQLQLGVSQVLPRGKSTALSRQQLQQQAEVLPWLQQDRRAQVRRTVSELWLEVYRTSQAITLITQDRILFEQLITLAEANYSNALASTRQQDVLRAQLELTRLEDRLAQLTIQYSEQKAALFSWLPNTQKTMSFNKQSFAEQTSRAPLAATLPRVPLLFAAQDWLVAASDDNQPKPSIESLTQKLKQQPALKAQIAQTQAVATGVALAKQQYQPQITLNASYGHRQDDPNGMARSDFASLGVAVNVPIFTRASLAKNVSASQSQWLASQTEVDVLLRQRLSASLQAMARLKTITQRQAIYQKTFLIQLNTQYDVALNAYTHYSGDFAEVLRARIEQLNAQIEAVNIEVERLKMITTLNYLLAADNMPPPKGSYVESSFNGDIHVNNQRNSTEGQQP